MVFPIFWFDSPPGLRGPDEKCCAVLMEKDVMADRCVVKQERMDSAAEAASFLIAAAGTAVQSGMAGKSGVSALRKKAAQLIHLAAREAADDTGLRLEAFEEARQLGCAVPFGRDFDEQVLTVEAGDKLVRALQAQTSDDGANPARSSAFVRRSRRLC